MSSEIKNNLQETYEYYQNIRMDCTAAIESFRTDLDFYNDQYHKYLGKLEAVDEFILFLESFFNLCD